MGCGLTLGQMLPSIQITHTLNNQSTLIHCMSNTIYFYTCPVCLQIPKFVHKQLCVFKTNSVIIYAYKM